jgi:hypothetical protein
VKLLATILVVGLLACPVMAGSGLDFGVLLSKDAAPEFGYAVHSDFSIESLLGPVIDKMEVSALYADRDWGDEATEVYAMRAFALKDYAFGKFFAAIGAGTWAFANTSGADFAHSAVTAEGGYRLGSFQFHVGGDIVSRDGPDMYYPHIGASISF